MGMEIIGRDRKVEELLGKIGELEEKLENLLSRYQEKLSDDRGGGEKHDTLQARISELQEENDELKLTLDKVRERTTRLVDRLEEMMENAEQQVSLF